MIKSSPINKDRNIFIGIVIKEGFKQAIKKFGLIIKMSTKERIKDWFIKLKK